MPIKQISRGALHIKVKTAKKRKSSSSRWLERQLNDIHCQMAKRDNFRSRAAYKLIEMNDSHGILKKGFNVLDLGCAPGSWLQVAQQTIGKSGNIIGIDILPMQDIENISFIQADFIEEQDKILEELPKDMKFNTILSDIAPNTSGDQLTDHLRIMSICDEIMEFARKFLMCKGSLIMKIFQGRDEQELVSTLKKEFDKIKYYKPKASRKISSEIYLVAIGKKK